MPALTMKEAKYCATKVVNNMDITFKKSGKIGSDKLSFFINETIFEEAVLKAEQYLQVFKKPNVSKIAGYYAFWFRKLKPFYVSLKETNTYTTSLNEVFAFLYGITLMKKHQMNIILGNSFFNDLVYSLRYHSFSPQSLTLIFQAILNKNKFKEL